MKRNSVALLAAAGLPCPATTASQLVAGCGCVGRGAPHPPACPPQASLWRRPAARLSSSLVRCGAPRGLGCADAGGATHHLTHRVQLCCVHMPAVPWSINPYGTAAASVARTVTAAGSGDFGLTVTAGGNQPIVLAGPALALTAGEVAFQTASCRATAATDSTACASAQPPCLQAG
jgi:hypothetical protein